MAKTWDNGGDRQYRNFEIMSRRSINTIAEYSNSASFAMTHGKNMGQPSRLSLSQLGNHVEEVKKYDRRVFEECQVCNDTWQKHGTTEEIVFIATRKSCRGGQEIRLPRA